MSIDARWPRQEITSRARPDEAGFVHCSVDAIGGVVNAEEHNGPNHLSCVFPDGHAGDHWDDVWEMAWRVVE